MNNIEKYYNLHYDEWGRLSRHRIEFEVTKRFLDKYIKEGDSVLDIGGGPGRYSIYLAKKGHDVTLVDLCEEMVNQAEVHAKEAGVALKGYIKGSVLELSVILPDKKYNAVLCMGPMYHLLEESHREEAVRQSMKFLKKGGVLIVSFISVYANIMDCLSSAPQSIGEKKVELLKMLTDGRYVVGDNNKGFTDAYFTNPASLEQYMSGFGLEQLGIYAVEGLGTYHEKGLMQLPEEDFQKWIDLFVEIAGNSVIWGNSCHLLYIGRKM